MVTRGKKKTADCIHVSGIIYRKMFYLETYLGVELCDMLTCIKRLGIPLAYTLLQFVV